MSDSAYYMTKLLQNIEIKIGIDSLILTSVALKETWIVPYIRVDFDLLMIPYQILQEKESFTL